MWEDAAASEIPHRPNAADLAILDQETSPALEADMKAAMDRLRSTKKRVLPEEEMQLRFASMRRTSHNRTLLLSNPFNDARTSYFHKSLGGYHGAKLKRYQELIEFQLAPAIGRVSAMLQTGTSMEQMDSLLAREGVLNMLNARYLIYNPERPPITNLNAFGPAWFVDELRWAKNADDEITALDEVDLARTAVIDERFRSMFPTPPVADPSASVEFSSYETNNLKYVVRSSSGGVVVFSEIWYGPDWKAYIDGQPVEYARANYVLRALAVPAGEHTVEFRVESRAFNASAPIALASSGLLILLVLLLLGMEVKRMLGTAKETA
jgi:hypothetical protein